MSKILEEKKNDLITRAETILESAKTENRELTDDEAQELAEIRDDVKKIKEKLGIEDDMREMLEGETKEDNTPQEEDRVEERAIKVGSEILNIREADYIEFDKMIRDETATYLTKGDNGAVIPTTIVSWIIRKVYDICPILERSQKFNVKGTLQIPYYPYDANHINVAYADEFTQLTSSSGKFGSVTLTGFLAGALTKVSRSLVNNAQIDVVAFVVDEMAYAIKRFIEHELLIGTPADDYSEAKVLGLSTLNNKVTTASASAITLDDIIKVHDKIKDEFQTNAIWIMSPATRTALRCLKSNTGYPLLNDDVSTPFGATLLGKPVYVSDNMPNIGAGNDVIYYGDMHGLATKFNEDINVQVLRERFADEHVIGVIGWFEFDGKICDEQQIAKLTMGNGGSV